MNWDEETKYVCMYIVDMPIYYYKLMSKMNLEQQIDVL